MIDNPIDLIKNHEGYSEQIYLDSLGYPTTGYGCLLDNSQSFSSLKEWHEYKFFQHFEEAKALYNQLGLDLDPVREAAVLDLLYNMKRKFLIQFKETISALKMKDFYSAGNHLEHSLWYKQVGRRGPRIVKLIKEGRWEVL